MNIAWKRRQLSEGRTFCGQQAARSLATEGLLADDRRSVPMARYNQRRFYADVLNWEKHYEPKRTPYFQMAQNDQEDTNMNDDQRQNDKPER